MKNALIIFENTLSGHKDKANELIEDLGYNLTFKELNDEKVKVDELLFDFLEVLKKLELLNNENTTSLIKALIRAKVKKEEEKLYQHINEMSVLRAKIEEQKNVIKNTISQNFYELKQSIEKSDFKEEISTSLNDAFLFEAEMLGILREIAESAFITTLEKGDDIELESSEIAKNLVYKTICELEFEKERILKSTQIVLNTAFELANESKNYAKELCIGVVKGTQEGIALGIEKFKTSFNYCTLEEDLSNKEKELIDIEYDFITLLRLEAKKSDEPVQSIIKNLLENELDTLFAKLKRLASESREQLLLMLNDLKKNPKINDFGKLAQSKINIFKKEISDLEQLTSERYKDFNTQEAKKLGINLWEKAKKFIGK
ncbi:hypothetical protein CQA38_07315 [Campylobacter sp. MIT 12-5580]|uniref:hypothetical protein n=1 Tax=Campylobacter sp. MIT 12-5580 TaxID=2040651 RepID=UPI0010F46277|nr:hypothetical protein [Campylobacter sp. MIT 12-5580]TKX28477.1 hypothetical protein CQA38_07315 [Campylobacter sp. MIT 12-5580]